MKPAELLRLHAAAVPPPYRATGPSSVVGCAISAQPDPKKNTQVLGTLFDAPTAAYLVAAGNAAPGLIAQLNAARQEAAEAEREKRQLHEELRGLRGLLSRVKPALDAFGVYRDARPAPGEWLAAKEVAEPLSEEIYSALLHRGTEEGEGVQGE